MKNEQVLAKKYIQALSNTLPADKAAGELIALVELLSFMFNQADYREYFFSPIVKNSEKHALLEKVLIASALSEQTQKFVLFLIEKNRFNLCKYLIVVAQKQINLLLNQIDVKLSFANEKISPNMQDVLVQVIADQFKGLKPLVTYHQKPEILGGFIIETSEKRIEASIKNDLMTFKRNVQKVEA